MTWSFFFPHQVMSDNHFLSHPGTVTGPSYCTWKVMLPVGCKLTSLDYLYPLRPQSIVIITADLLQKDGRPETLNSNIGNSSP